MDATRCPHRSSKSVCLNEAGEDVWKTEEFNASARREGSAGSDTKCRSAGAASWPVAGMGMPAERARVKDHAMMMIKSHHQPMSGPLLPVPPSRSVAGAQAAARPDQGLRYVNGGLD